MERQINVTLEPVDDCDEPCCFCSSDEHEAYIEERGVITAEYRMENTYGVTMGYTCGMCVEADTR